MTPSQEEALVWAHKVTPRPGETQEGAALRQRSTFGALYPGHYTLAVAYVRLAVKQMREANVQAKV